MCLKTYTEAKARRAGSHLVTGCTGGCHFDTVRCGQGGRGLSLWWPYGLRFPDLVYILSFLFIMNITEMIGISLRIVFRCFHDLMFLLCWEIKNSWFQLSKCYRQLLRKSLAWLGYIIAMLCSSLDNWDDFPWCSCRVLYTFTAFTITIGSVHSTSK